MNDTTIITINDIKEVTSISNNIDVEQLEPFLMTSQDLHIRPILGDALMDAVISSVGTGGTDYTTLVENYILKALAYASWHSAAPFLHMKTQKKGIVKQNSDNSDNIDINEFGIYSERIESTMTFYLRRLKEYLDDNKELYPLYSASSQINPSNSSSIFLGF
jgi:hypothetical protein